MEDLFFEQIVKRKKDTIQYVKMVMILITAVILLVALGSLFIAFPAIAFLTPILLAGCVYGTYWIISSLNLEYEYVVTNGDLDIDCIINRRRRKHIYSGRARDFEIMACLDSEEFEEVTRASTGAGNKMTIKSLECSSIPGQPTNWFFVGNYKSERVMVFLSPDDRILKTLKRHNPSKIKYTPPVD